MTVLETFVHQLSTNPLNIALLGFLIYQIYSYVRGPSKARAATAASIPPPTHPETIVYMELTPRSLRQYDGRNADTKIYMGVNGLVYDVTKGRNFYGPDGAYGNFAGRDASRGLAKGSFDLDMLTPIDQPLDTLDDLTPQEWEALRDWQGLFESKYIHVGKLVNDE